MTYKHKYLPLDPVTNRFFKVADETTLPAVYVPEGGRLPATADLTVYFGPIEDQGPLGSCTAFSSTQWYSAWQVKNGKPWVEYSELAQYWEERNLEGTVNEDSGAQMIDAVNVLEQFGVEPESVDPYDVSKFKVKPDESKFSGPLPSNLVKRINPQSVLDDTLDALSHGTPVLFGYIVYPEMEQSQVATTGILPMPSSNEQPIGGHAVVAVGFSQDSKWIVVRNQWGAQWGKSGYFYMPYDYYAQYVEDAYVIEDSATPVPAPNPPQNTMYLYTTDPMDQHTAHLLESFFAKHHITFNRTTV